MRNRLVDRLVDKAEVLERYGELYEIFDDSREIQKEIDKIYDKINDLPYVEVKAIPTEWIKNYASHKASKDLIDCYWHFWEDDVLKMVAEWEKENDNW